MNPHTQTSTGFGFNARSRSIDVYTKRTTQNPFSLTNSPKGVTGRKGSHIAAGVGKGMSYPVNEMAKRFKNISDREAPANHISDKVYATA